MVSTGVVLLRRVSSNERESIRPVALSLAIYGSPPHELILAHQSTLPARL